MAQASLISPCFSRISLSLSLFFFRLSFISYSKMLLALPEELFYSQLFPRLAGRDLVALACSCKRLQRLVAAIPPLHRAARVVHRTLLSRLQPLRVVLARRRSGVASAMRALDSLARQLELLSLAERQALRLYIISSYEKPAELRVQLACAAAGLATVLGLAPRAIAKLCRELKFTGRAVALALYLRQAAQPQFQLWASDLEALLPTPTLAKMPAYLLDFVLAAASRSGHVAVAQGLLQHYGWPPAKLFQLGDSAVGSALLAEAVAAGQWEAVQQLIAHLHLSPHDTRCGSWGSTGCGLRS